MDIPQVVECPNLDRIIETRVSNQSLLVSLHFRSVTVHKDLVSLTPVVYTSDVSLDFPYKSTGGVRQEHDVPRGSLSTPLVEVSRSPGGNDFPFESSNHLV